MSAIAGVLALDDGLEPLALVRHLTRRLQHRGPDGISHWSFGRVALGHCMLRATPESVHEQQPLVDIERGIALVFDGRLDNRDDLHAALKPGLEIPGVPDSHYVLEAYARWGEECAHHLLGDFAFAIWDMRAQRLFCARDPVGAAGFCFVRAGRLIAFATENEALVGLPGVGNAPNEAYIAHLLVPEFQNWGDRRGWMRDVDMLLPGEWLRVVPDGRVETGHYRQPAAEPRRRYASYAECEAHFLEVFGRAVLDRMRARGDFAMMLSGGLDSAGILAMARRLSVGFPDRGFHTYSAIDDEPEYCLESRSILSLARSAAAELHTLCVPSFTGMANAADLADTAWRGAHPVANAILLPALMCQGARRDGHRALLIGASGDLAMKAPVYYPAALLKEGCVRDAWQESRAASRNNYYLQGRSPLGVFLGSAARALAPVRANAWWRRLRSSRRPALEKNSLINPRFAERLCLEERLVAELAANEAALQANEDQFRRTRIVRQICSGLTGAGLVAGRAGIEVRDPWSDVRVLDCFFRMPDKFKVQNGWTKFPVRSAFGREIEPFVLERKDKSHLGWKFTLRVLQDGHAELSRLIARNLDAVAQYVDLPAFRDLAASYVDRGDLAHGHTLFDVLTLNFWLKRIRNL